MKDQLTQLRELGVKELSVTNDLATAVNPYMIGSVEYYSFAYHISEYLNLPPLPTSGIPDGPVGIDEVEPFTQMKYPVSHWTDSRQVLRRKQQEEVKPEGEMSREDLLHIVSKLKGALTICKNSRKSWIDKYAKLQQSTSSLPQPEQQEQTAEGKQEAKKVQYYQVPDGELWVYPFIRNRLRLDEHHSDINICLTIDRIADFAEGFRDLHLSQYKASLIDILEQAKRNYIKVGRLAESTGVQITIDLIKNHKP